MTSLEISKKYYLTRSTIQHRTAKLGLITEPKKNKYYTDEEVEQVVNFLKKPYLNTRFTNKNKIEIIDLFLTLKDNSCPNIAEYLGLNWSYVSEVVNEWIENDKTIIVASKL